MLAEMINIKAEVKDRTLFEIEQLSIHQGERIGLVGKNGYGKTTLLEIIAGARSPDSGSCHVHTSCKLLPQLKSTTSTKSGGEITQAYINHYLAAKPELLLADEPTANLDERHIDKLEQQLKRWQGAFVIVSHDRAFLDALCTSIWEIADEKLSVYQGNYSDYLIQKTIETQEKELAYEKYQSKKKQLEKALQLKEAKAQRATKKPKNVSASEAKITGAKPYFAKKQKKLHQSGKAIESRIEQLEKVEKPKSIEPIQMDLPNENTLKGRIITVFDNVTGMAGEQLLWKIRHIDVKNGDKIALIGDNGSGKTTLVKQIMQASAGITVSPAVKIGYFSQNIDVLDTKKSILDNVSATAVQSETIIRTVLARLHFFGDDVYKKVNVLSGGERVKVSFAKIFVSDVNFLLLDEPTNFLDIESVEALEELLVSYLGTVLFVSHDRRLIDNIATRIFSIKNQAIQVFDGSYKEFKEIAATSMNQEEETLFVLETKISEVLGKLSIEPTQELEEEFERLLDRKKKLTES